MASSLGNYIVVFLLFLILLVWVYYRGRISEIAMRRATELFNEWRERELEKQVEMRLKPELEKWKEIEEENIRRDAISRSISTILGKVGESLAPLLIWQEYGVNPKDMRFLGTPVDYIVFKGLSDENPEEIWFVEVKSGKSTELTSRERRIRDLVESKKVRWITLHLQSELEKLRAGL
jgi:predicted Holliday junction resolvase-like endonuclease